MSNPSLGVHCLLGDLAPGDLMQVGPFGSQLHASDYTSEGVAVIMPSDLRDGRLDVRKAARVSTETTVALEKHILMEGDLVFARRGDIGRVALVRAADLPALCGTGCIRVRLKGDVSGQVVLEACRLPAAQRWLKANAVGQTMLNLNGDILARLPLCLPAFTEHDSIKRFVLRNQDCTEAIAALLAAKRKQQTAFIERLGSGACGYHASLTSRDDVIELRAIAGVVTDRVDPALLAADFPCVELEHIEPLTGQLLSHATCAEAASLKTPFRKGDCLFGKLRPYLRKLHQVAFDGVCSTEVWVIRPTTPDLEPDYLMLLLDTPGVRRAANVTSGTRMPRADWDVVGEAPVWLPSRAVQLEIVKAAHLLRDEINGLRTLHRAIERQHRGVLQSVFTQGHALTERPGRRKV